MPLLAGDLVVGALDVQSTLPYAFGTEDVAILVTMADQLAVALQNARLFDQTARQARRESQVVEITGKIRAAGDMDAMLRTAVSELRRALGASKAAVRLDQPGGARPVDPAAAESPAPTLPAAADQPRPSGTGKYAPSGSNGNGAHKHTGGPNGGPTGGTNGNGHGPSHGTEG